MHSFSQKFFFSDLLAFYDLVVGHGPPLLVSSDLNTGRTYPSSGLVLAQLGVVEPKSNLLGSSIERVGSVDQVSARLSAFSFYTSKTGRNGEGRWKDVPDRDGILTPNGSRVRLLGVGSSHDPSLYVSPVSLTWKRRTPCLMISLPSQTLVISSNSS